MRSPLASGFGQRLREERERLGMLQTTFAEAGGVKRVTQYLYENENHSPTLKYLMAVAALGVDLQYLIFGTRGTPQGIEFELELLDDIYRVVDEIGRDRGGRLLPLDVRRNFFKLLYSAYAGKTNKRIDVKTARKIVGKTR